MFSHVKIMLIEDCELNSGATNRRMWTEVMRLMQTFCFKRYSKDMVGSERVAQDVSGITTKKSFNETSRNDLSLFKKKKGLQEFAHVVAH